jgi:hypothetical protein
MTKATAGRIVHYVMPSGKHRPSIVVEPWEGDMVNLQVFLDGSNDSAHAAEWEHSRGIAWKTSIHYAPINEDGSVEPNTWHWPEVQSEESAE